MALQLARAGEPHLLVERTVETGDALCGGFLSWRTLEMLEALGVRGETLNPDTISRVRLYAGGRVAETLLPRPARAVSRKHLDTILLQTAIDAGAAVERGVTVRTIEDGRVRLDNDTELTPEALFLANGKHDIRGVARPAAARGADPTVGIRLRLGPRPKLTSMVRDAIELHLFDRGYAGLVMQENDTANLCLAVHKSRLQEAGDVERLLLALARESPALSDRLSHRSVGSAVDAVANVPYGWRIQTGQSGLFRLGDQACVIPSLAGEGMAIAIASGSAAANAYLGSGPEGAVAFQRAFDRRVRTPIRVASTIWSLANGTQSAAFMVGLARAAPSMISFVASATRIRPDI